MKRTRFRLRHLLALLLSAFVFPPPSYADADLKLEGVWRTRRQSEITISKCYEGYCGRISKVVVPKEIFEANKNHIEGLSPDQYYDFKNPEPDLRRRPILGLRVLTLTSKRTAKIYDGEIYNPEDGNTYTGYVELISQSRLKLTGCGFFSLICRGENWELVHR